HDSGIRTKEPPLNMLLAMGIAAFLCIAIGVFPHSLYDILPYPAHFVPYTAGHVVNELQLLMFGALAFCLLMLAGYYPAEMRALNLDTDWFYRKGGRLFYYVMQRGLNGLNGLFDRAIAQGIPVWLGHLSRTPLTSVVSLYMKARGKDRVAIEEFKRETSPEATSLMSMGVPVLISILFLFALFVVFAV
ncbi:MAG: Na(+)/H(+) antiporter subunit D, partial [Desulfobacterales bacterium]|nr:Na(+)/H(+) antiporter subunit D [Desulfobacterales bacterium]